MKVLLGMLARTDRSRDPYRDRVLSIVAPSFDGVEVLEDGGRPITDFAEQRNKLIALGERKGYDWMFMLDSDECMFPEDITRVKSLMTPHNRLVVLPRYELVADFDHYDPQGYPDYQGRVFRLGIGYRFRRRVHEGLYRRWSPLSEMRLRRGVISETTPIYHYGRVQAPEELQLKFYNYDLLAAGKPPVKELPSELREQDATFRWGQVTPFTRPHPLRDL